MNGREMVVAAFFFSLFATVKHFDVLHQSRPLLLLLLLLLPSLASE